MEDSRKKPGVAFWATVVVVVALVGYPLSVGPTCWVASRTNMGRSAILRVVYRPILFVFDSGPAWLVFALDSYSKLGADEDWAWIIDNDREGSWMRRSDFRGEPE